MTPYLKYWPYLLIAILTVIVIFLFNERQRDKLTISNQESVIQEKDAVIKYRTTENGQIIADKVAAETRAKDLETAYPRLAKTITQDMDIRLRNLRTSIQAEFRAFNTGHSAIIRDTIKLPGKALEFVDSIKVNDHYLNFLAAIKQGETSLNWQYSYQDSITLALHVKKKWIFGKETLHSSMMLQNPNAKVINSTSVQLKDFRDKRWVISVGASYDPFSNQIRPAIHAGWALFKF